MMLGNSPTVVRVLFKTGGGREGAFDNDVALNAAIKRYDDDPKVLGIYVVMNECNDAAFKRSPNVIDSATGVSAPEIVRRTHMLIDFDPSKAVGVPTKSASSDLEKEDTKTRAKACAEYLLTMGWKVHYLGDSGNGTHLIYDIDLPNDVESEALIKNVYAHLNLKGFNVDSGVFDAPRIVRYYGTLNKKGTPTMERPHRRSAVHETNDWEVVTKDMLQVLCPKKEPRAPKAVAGSRHNSLKEYLVKMKGAGAEVTYDFAMDFMKQCERPDEVDSTEVSKLVAWVNTNISQKGVADDRLTEAKAAEQFVEYLNGDAVFNYSTKRWHVWNGKIWQEDNRQIVQDRCFKFVRRLYKHTADFGDNVNKVNEYVKDVNALNGMRGVKDIIGLAAIKLTKISEDFDTDPTLFCIRNGTLEFTREGLVFHNKHRKEDMISLMGDVDYLPQEPAPQLWVDHINTVAEEDAELVKSIQTTLGYTLGGVNPLQIFMFLIGSGRNGKSVTLALFSMILGTYVQDVNPQTLMESGNKQASPERKQMRGKRLVIAQETKKEEGKDRSLLDTSFIKATSGGDKVNVRDLHQNNPEAFVFNGVICLSTNALPRTTDNTIAFRDRLVVIPFPHYFAPEERDGEIIKKLSAVKSGILNWFIEGWEQTRLEKRVVTCQQARDARDEYIEDNDEYAVFLHDNVEQASTKTLPAEDLWVAYQRWSNGRQGLMPTNERTFKKDMRARLGSTKSNHGLIFKGIILKNQDGISWVDTTTHK